MATWKGKTKYRGHPKKTDAAVYKLQEPRMWLWSEALKRIKGVGLHPWGYGWC